MHTLHRFEIHYRLHGRPCHFVQRDTLMTDADAWYYASLHSGTGLGLQVDSGCQVALRQQAGDAGLSDVTWVKLP
ncbi:hypothetical protein PMM47T1_07806 [Pseudomonas sp. M47T1]|uniref:DUF6555 family protein n=1 Tax=unclassified Pseudomonas TaxID=196821 RepID=UPI0002606EF6|nr:DUF6555 family protein [Pseudomonas sp. M47T1]EIK97029.1 hypothetical protein PMM47T1_07806 [Pseudomonas sp. M47T1]